MRTKLFSTRETLHNSLVYDRKIIKRTTVVVRVAFCTQDGGILAERPLFKISNFQIFKFSEHVKIIVPLPLAS